MGNFDKNYNFIKIYSNYEAFKLEKTSIISNIANNNPIKTLIIGLIKILTLMKVSKISDSNFDKICKLNIKNK